MSVMLRFKRLTTAAYAAPSVKNGRDFARYSAPLVGIRPRSPPFDLSQLQMVDLPTKNRIDYYRIIGSPFHPLSRRGEAERSERCP